MSGMTARASNAGSRAANRSHRVAGTGHVRMRPSRHSNTRNGIATAGAGVPSRNAMASGVLKTDSLTRSSRAVSVN